MTFVKLEKTLKYHNVQESLQSENFAGYYLWIKKYFFMFCSYKHIPQA